MDTKHCLIVCAMVLYQTQSINSFETNNALISTTAAQVETCSEDEEFKLCELCPRTCDSPTPTCTLICSKGCFCKEGLMRNKDGRCVNYDKCPRVLRVTDTLPSARPTLYHMSCGPRQMYKSCGSCEKTCTNRNPMCVDGGCVAGCFCEEGFIKAPNGQCVKMEDCPQAEMIMGGNEPLIEECMVDEVFVFCGWCERTCSDPNPVCPIHTCTRGCVCRPPLLRHYSGHCLEEANCKPVKCRDPNEEYGCRYGCESKCAYENCVRPSRCRLGCHCKLGLYRSSSRKCLPRKQCLEELNNTITI